VTHNLTDILPETSRVVFLKNGRIFADGAKEELLTSASLSRLFDAPLEVVRRDGYFYLW
jgi:iron complex transport system ATP-binding protein